jgi:polysaccharide deacetylase family protein (PEP-CTERM system associated)
LATYKNPRAIINALTFDVEDYFHASGFDQLINRSQWDDFESRVVPNTYRILAALERADTKATFFVLGWVADKHPQLVRRIHAAGHEIGCHSYGHHPLPTLTPDEFRIDLCRGRDILQDLIGERVTAYRAPDFSLTRQTAWALDILIEEGFAVDSSVDPTLHDHLGGDDEMCGPHLTARPSGQLWEFPMPTRRVLGFPLPVGGGGCLRLYPYRLTRHVLSSINSLRLPFVMCLQPWELDPGQPRFAPGRWRAFRHYVNLHRTPTRLAALLEDFQFGTITEALACVMQRRRRAEHEHHSQFAGASG